ncbi:olfactory receptor 5AR1-like [Ambystoma mexicanum]|uniref:olfactory receptor 5AR1-like n=1 Tax=Ambystoma mexicanum TaxID=8296 RepID=UPI0037E73658
MDESNKNMTREFTLFGLTDIPWLQVPLLVFFLLIYILTLLGNIGMVTLIWISSPLHTPMYFLLGNLSCIDICYSSVISPKMLSNFLSKTKVISFFGCATQMFLFGGLGTAEILLLAVMAYDRYSAICKPLQYSVIMNKRVCIYLVAGVLSIGFLNSLIQTILVFQLSYCGSHTISHFFCDIPPLLKLSCSDTSLNEIVLFALSGWMIVGSLLVIIVSYAYIIAMILKIQLSHGRYRTFSTCSSHFVSVTLLYGTILFMYLRPSSAYSLHQDRVASVFYAVLIPMLNPLIYSLRNKEVKGALEKCFEKYFMINKEM